MLTRTGAAHAGFKAVLGIAAAAVLALAIGACGSSSDSGSSGSGSAGGGASTGTVAQDSGGGKTVDSITWATNHTISSLDPGLVYDSGGNNFVTFAECDSLLRFGDDLTLKPGLATSWKQTSPTSYVYQLNPAAKFWDGHPVTPADVAFSINRILGKALASPLQSLTTGGEVKGVKATGPHEVTMVLKKPNPMARWLAATPVGQVVERAFAQREGKAFGTAPSKVMCSGAYRPTAYSKGASTVLQAVDDYWDTAHQPHIKQVTVKEISDPAAIVAGLRSGDITGTFDLDARNAALLSREPSLKVALQPGVQINYVSPNLLKGPLQNAKARRGLTLAIDRVGLASAISGDAGEPLKGPVTPGIASYQQQIFNTAYKNLDLPLKPDLEQAKQLVAESGEKGATVKIGVLASGTADTVAAALDQAGKDVGLDVKVVKLPSSTYFAENFSGKLPRTYDALVNFWAPDFPDPAAELIPPFASRFSDVEGFESAAYRKLESQWAASRNNSPAQANLLVKMESMLIDQTVKIPLYVDPLVQVHSASIGGYTQTKLYYYQPVLLSMSGS